MTSELIQERLDVPMAIDAIAAMRLLADRDPMLLDGAGAHPEARRSFIALDPLLRWTARRDGQATHVTVEDRAGRVIEESEDPLASLRSWTKRTRFSLDEPAGFTGGWAGFFGYECTRWFEPTLPQMHTGEFPDASLALYADVIVIEAGGRAQIIATDLPSDADIPIPTRDPAGVRARALLATLAAATGANDPPAEPIGAPEWTTSLTGPEFQEAAQNIRDLIAAGDLYQANLTTRFSTRLDVDPLGLYAAMRRHNPAPFMGFWRHGNQAILSNSPEQLFCVNDGRIRSRPIAGTRPRSDDPDQDRRLEAELLSDDKEQAEHRMLVDLVRNDIARVATPGTVRVGESNSVERYRRVMHLVSRVDGDVRSGTDFVDWMAALFPGGTITGAPKHRACQRIREAEPVARGPYTGSLGFLSWSHQAHWNILIRTLMLDGKTAHVHAGSGIVMDSDPAAEWSEAGHKAQAILEAGAGDVSDAPPGTGSVTPHGTWKPQIPTTNVPARVLLIDNYDSFVYNLADYCAALGADVHVVRNDADWRTALAAIDPTHVVLSPGPGRPEDAGKLIEIVDAVRHLPTLGVCLGHQAIALADGAPVLVHPAMHGKTSDIAVVESTLFPDGGRMEVARYHSLIVKEAPPGWQVTARLDDGIIMAIEHAQRPHFGVQFHPESMGTPAGLQILLRFLQTESA